MTPFRLSTSETLCTTGVSHSYFQNVPYKGPSSKPDAPISWGRLDVYIRLNRPTSQCSILIRSDSRQPSKISPLDFYPEDRYDANGLPLQTTFPNEILINGHSANFHNRHDPETVADTTLLEGAMEYPSLPKPGDNLSVKINTHYRHDAMFHDCVRALAHAMRQPAWSEHGKPYLHRYSQVIGPHLQAIQKSLDQSGELIEGDAFGERYALIMETHPLIIAVEAGFPGDNSGISPRSALNSAAARHVFLEEVAPHISSTERALFDHALWAAERYALNPSYSWEKPAIHRPYDEVMNERLAPVEVWARQTIPELMTTGLI